MRLALDIYIDHGSQRLKRKSPFHRSKSWLTQRPVLIYVSSGSIKLQVGCITLLYFSLVVSTKMSIPVYFPAFAGIALTTYEWSG